MSQPESLLPDNQPIQDNIIELFRELFHAFLTASVPAWLDLQLTLPQLRALFIVAHGEKSSVTQIAKHLGIGEPTASHLVDKLVQAGLVNRNEDPEDRRRAVVRLSPPGEDLIEKLLGWEELLRAWLHQMSREDLSLAQHGLEAIVREMHGQTIKEEL